MRVGDLALSGQWEEIMAQYFDIKEDMTMEFQGEYCNIEDAAGSFVEQFDKNSGEVKKDVFVGFRCYVMKAKVRFTKVV